MTPDWELVGKATEFVAEEMGVALKRSALSPNIRERMDHSCAIVSSDGSIVAQAEHIPVHLGSFAVGTRRLLEALREYSVEIAPGDMVLVNDPYISGTHLNDLTLLAPIYWHNHLIGYATNKAHHVDVGGPVPGSLNPAARDIFGEGVVIPPVRVVRDSHLDPTIFRAISSNVRDPRTVLGDLQAQVAANRMGIARVRDILDRFGEASVTDGWNESRRRVRRLVKSGLAGMIRGSFRSVDYLELEGNLLPIRLALTVSPQGVFADFSGTIAQVSAPLNAVLGVTYSATAFAVRSVLGLTLPTNAGFYECIEIVAPPGSLVNPLRPAPVSGGNVETSQRIADVVLSALSAASRTPLPAASSGTMMNIMLGGQRINGRPWAYYETVGGGSGARPNSNGVSGIHTNMTNTLNTPIEVAEREYPLLFTRYGLRRGSGGKGYHKGGNGLVRGFRLLEPATVSILSDRFRVGPRGCRGGQPGKTGEVRLRVGGRVRRMTSKFTMNLGAEAEVIVETPGGGGFGLASSSPSRHR